jgi:dTDP-4-amino-4,6-dideoxygalactose transaminase
MLALQAIAARSGLAIVEDAAQAHGAEIRGRRVGSFGTGSFSFYATKNVSCGEGGAVTTNDDATARRLRLLRNQGMAARYEYDSIGSNLRMTELQAAVGLPAMARLGEITRLRRRNADRLSDELRRQDRLTRPVEPPDRGHVWHQYTVLARSTEERAALEAHLDDRGIASGRYYPKVIYHYEVFGSHKQVVADRCPRAENVAGRCLSVPVHDQLEQRELDRVVEALQSYCADRVVTS